MTSATTLSLRSAVFDEVWHVFEVDGVSRFKNLTRAGGLAEL